MHRSGRGQGDAGLCRPVEKDSDFQVPRVRGLDKQGGKRDEQTE